eukprot:Colp12_sorted_trinity150504_noHs@13793
MTETTLQLDGTNRGCMVLKLKGSPPNLKQVENALLMLERKQPLLRCVLIKLENGSYAMKPTGIKSKVSFVDRLDMNTWKTTFTKMEKKPLELGSKPIEIVIVRNPTELVQEYEIMLWLEHNVTDGKSMLQLAHDFLNHLNGVPQDFCAALRYPPTVETAILKQMGGRFYQVINLIRVVIKAILTSICADEPERLPIAGNIPKEHRQKSSNTSFVTTVFSEEETMQILAACKKRKVTLTGALLAALASSVAVVNQEHCGLSPLDEVTIAAGVAVDLRSRYHAPL